MQGVLERVQAQLHQQRLKRALSQTRGQHVDIQIGFNVYLEVPQEMRSRLWLVILQEPSLAVPFQVRSALLAVNNMNGDVSAAVCDSFECSSFRWH